MTRRALVLTDETARHPFLRSLPPHVRLDVAPVTLREQIRTPSRWAFYMADLRHFVTAYCASLAAVLVFFA